MDASRAELITARNEVQVANMNGEIPERRK
jgi:hypothetical protein